MNNVCLLISTAQGPAECRLFARFIADTVCREAAAQGLHCQILQSQSDQYGLRSALLQLTGTHAATAAAQWLGTWQWICPSPLRPRHPRKNWFVAVSLAAHSPEYSDNTADDIRFRTCRARGNGGQHLNKTESAVRAVHLPSGLSVRVENRRSQHANKKQARLLLAEKLLHQQQQNQRHTEQQNHRQRHDLERGNAVRQYRDSGFRPIPIENEGQKK